MTDALEAAHDYARRGWGVVPLYGITEEGHCRCRQGRVCPPKNAGKHPRGTKAGWTELRSGPDVQAWFEENGDDNLGVITGPASGLFVLDVDGAAGVNSITQLAQERGALPATRIVRTGSGGLHYYFRHPGHFTVRNSASWIARGIDIRGEGGQVVAPPSRSGLGAYEVIADYEVAEAPPWLLEALQEHSAHVDAGRNIEVTGAEPIPAEVIPDTVNNLRNQTAIGDGGRHQHFHAIVAACFEADLRQGQAVTIAAPWCAAVGKFVGRVEQEVARSWGKLEAERARETDWLKDAGSSNVVPLTGAPLKLVHSADIGTPPDSAESAPDRPTEAQEDALALGLGTTWAPVDLTAHLDGTYVPLTPTLMPRVDGACLLYPGLVHSFHGESESGKSMVAQAEVRRILAAGGSAAYLDFESDAASIVGRLVEMGADPAELKARFTYRHPEANPRNFPHERDAFMDLAGSPVDLIVIDGMTDALGVFGASSMDNDEIATFLRRFPRFLAARTGAAVILVDHVTKDTDNRGRFALGGQAKMAGLDGAAYTVEVKEPIGRGMRGRLELRVAKDRPGGIRPACGEYRARDRTQEAASVVVDSSSGRIVVMVEKPRLAGEGSVSAFRPTHYMERVSEVLEDAAEPMTRTAIYDLVGPEDKKPSTKQEKVKPAVDALLAEGFIKAVGNATGRGSGIEHIRPYREAEDPRSDSYLGHFSGHSPDSPDITGYHRNSESEEFTGSPPLPSGGPVITEPLPEGQEASIHRSQGKPYPEEVCPHCGRTAPAAQIRALAGRCGVCWKV
jgi:hypothetical protein